MAYVPFVMPMPVVSSRSSVEYVYSGRNYSQYVYGAGRRYYPGYMYGGGRYNSRYVQYNTYPQRTYYTSQNSSVSISNTLSPVNYS